VVGRAHSSGACLCAYVVYVMPARDAKHVKSEQQNLMGNGTRNTRDAHGTRVLLAEGVAAHAQRPGRGTIWVAAEAAAVAVMLAMVTAARHHYHERRRGRAAAAAVVVVTVAAVEAANETRHRRRFALRHVRGRRQHARHRGCLVED
jgi:hypothetical protein